MLSYRSMQKFVSTREKCWGTCSSSSGASGIPMYVIMLWKARYVSQPSNPTIFVARCCIMRMGVSKALPPMMSEFTKMVHPR